MLVEGERKEPLREESPDRFLSIFGEVSRMKSASELLLGQSPEPPKEAKQGKVLGVIVVGSSTDPKGQPKDLDVIFVVWGGQSNPKAWGFAEGVRDAFDLQLSWRTGQPQLGRLDLLGLAYIGKKRPFFHPSQIEALQNTKTPLVFAFSLEGAQKIQIAIEQIK